MAETVNVQIPVEEPQVEQVTNEVDSVSYRDVVKKLIADGAKRYNHLKIKNVTTTDMDTYIRVGLTLVPSIPGYDAEGNETKVNTIFVSLYSLVAVFRENEDYAWMGNVLLEKSDILPLILCGGEIDILNRHYDANTKIYNPYSKNKNQTPSVYDHGTYIRDVVEINLGKTGLKMADKLAEKLMGF